MSAPSANLIDSIQDQCARVQLPFLRPVGVLSSKTSPCLSRNLERRCFERERSSLASSSALVRSRAASHSSSGTHTSTTLPTDSMRARNSASLRSFFLRLSALGLIIFETAPTTQSTPRPESLFCRSKPVTPDSYTHLAPGSTERTHSATAPAS